MKIKYKIIGGFVILFLIYGCYKWYLSSMTIIVPKNYVGEVCLVLSNVDDDILTLDKNGIGYINEETYENLCLSPNVIASDGKNETERCVGFSPSAFWAKGITSEASTIDHPSKEIRYFSFELVPVNQKGKRQNYQTDLLALVDKAKVKWKLK
jgi:hypothetical protein